jgi:fructose-bisphosphate aldolase class II
MVRLIQLASLLYTAPCSLDLCSYDTSSAMGLVRAAERARSPGMILIFPATLAHFGRPFLTFMLDLAASASVPIAVHMDHATTKEDIETVLGFAEQGSVLDSLMIDASHADTDEENMAEVSGPSLYLPPVNVF